MRFYRALHPTSPTKPAIPSYSLTFVPPLIPLKPAPLLLCLPHYLPFPAPCFHPPCFPPLSLHSPLADIWFITMVLVGYYYDFDHDSNKMAFQGLVFFQCVISAPWRSKSCPHFYPVQNSICVCMTHCTSALFAIRKHHDFIFPDTQQTMWARSSRRDF